MRIPQSLTAIAAALALVVSPVYAGWAEKLFQETSYDFGTVPGGFDARHSFVARNVYGEPVRIAGFVVACGCTEVRVNNVRVRPDYPNQRIMLSDDERITLKPGETATIEMALDTKKFVGEHKTTAVTVIFDKPSYSTVRLQMAAYIRQDVVTNPGAVVFGTLDQGTPATREVGIEYAGGYDWRITTIQWNPDLFDLTASESYRGNRRVGYQIQVTLKPDVPPGRIRETIIVRTNDPSTPEIRIPVDATVVAAVTVTPSTVALGNVSVGSETKKTLIVRGKKAFKIIAARSSSPAVKIDFAKERQSTIHMVSLRFVPAETGDHEALIELDTDQDGPPLRVTLRAHVTP